MDKLRALEYFIAAAEEGSFSGAARRLDVSVPSIAKLIGSLETQLGARLITAPPRGSSSPPGARPTWKPVCRWSGNWPMPISWWPTPVGLASEP